MTAIADVVTLSDGSVGVISDSLPLSQWRVQFPDGTRIDVLSDAISATLAAPTYEAGDDVTVWPHMGTIQSISATDATVQLSRSERIKGVGHIEWTPTVTVPVWRLILDNDGRLQRI